AITGSQLPVMTLAFDDWGGFETEVSVVTGIAVQFRGGHQVTHALDDFAWLYTFGERVGPMTVSGVCFAGSCDGEDRHGIEGVLAYYGRKRLTRDGTPLTFAIGLRTAIEAFLVGVGTSMNDPAAGLGQFSLQLVAVPPADWDAGGL